MSSKVVNGVRWTQSARPSFPNVNVSINSACSGTDQGCYSQWTYGEWTMILQRRTGGTWRNIGSRTGYVRDNSPSNRTFTNVRKDGPMRVYTIISSSAYHGSVTLIDHIN